MNSSLIRACKARGVRVLIYMAPKRGYRAPRDDNGKRVKPDGRMGPAVDPEWARTGRYMPHQGKRECARRRGRHG